MVDNARRHLESAIAWSKCHGCGCFHDAITALGARDTTDALQALLAVAHVARIERQHDGLGCEPCWSMAAVEAVLPARDDGRECGACETRPSNPASAFVICIDRDAKELVAEHYPSQGQLELAVRGTAAVEVIAELMRSASLTRMEDAAYLGRELTRAEAALQSGGRYVQDHTPARGRHTHSSRSARAAQAGSTTSPASAGMSPARRRR